MAGKVSAGKAATSQPEAQPEEQQTKPSQGSGASSTPPRSYPRVPQSASSTVDSGAGFILGLLVWGWIVLPFLKNGPSGVRDTLRAKFFNKAPDGSWLP